MDEERQRAASDTSLPGHAHNAINRCNIPPAIIGGLTFQRHPASLQLDGVDALHSALFQRLDTIDAAASRAENFMDYMRSGFLLDHLDEAGLDPHGGKSRRGKADYLRILRGWLFDADGIEGAVLKSWVESRFGLLPINHHGPMSDAASDNYRGYLAARARGLYNTNALESQLDLLYSYCQYELRRQYAAETHLRLYRGVNRFDRHEVLQQPSGNSYILLLNNISSFTGNRERADEFGDYILEAKIPLVKLVYIPGLLPGALKGEEEYLVIGGVYEVDVNTW